MFKTILLTLALLQTSLCLAGTELNLANVAELDGIKGIGPALSERILNERKQGKFKDWPDFLARVKGVAQSAAVKFSDQGLTINGAGFGVTPAIPERPITPRPQ